MSKLYSDFIVPASVIIPIVIGFCRCKTFEISHRFLIAFLCFSIFFSIIGILSTHFFHNNILINELYTLVEFPLVAGFYYYQFSSKRMRKIITWITPMFIFFCICLIFIFAKVVRFDDYSTSVESLLVIFFSLALINERSNLLSNNYNWEQEPVNWFNTGLLLYFSGSLFIFLSFNYFLFTISIGIVIWNVHATFFLLMNVLIAIGFIKIKDDAKECVKNH